MMSLYTVVVTVVVLLPPRRVGSCSCVIWEVSWLYLWDEGQGCGGEQVELWSVVNEASVYITSAVMIPEQF